MKNTDNNVSTEKSSINFFQKYLSVWVVACMIVGVLISKYIPIIPLSLSRLEYANVSIPIAILIWLMIYPMMMSVDFESIRDISKNPKGLYLTWIINWLVKPFSMFFISSFFFYFLFKNIIPTNLAKEYLIGAVLLGTAPCTAMVFVWSALTKGNSSYTVVQVATNDLIILFLFVPIVKFLLGISDIFVPWITLFLSIILFVLIPIILGIVTRIVVCKKYGVEYFSNIFIHKFDNITIIGLLLTLVLLFSFQGNIILSNPLHIILISIPLILQTFIIFALSYIIAYILKLPHNIASPAAMIGASNFFELAVAVAISLFGVNSGATLATIVGVLVEVPVMLFLVNISNKTKDKFQKGV